MSSSLPGIGTEQLTVPRLSTARIRRERNMSNNAYRYPIFCQLKVNKVNIKSDGIALVRKCEAERLRRDK